MPTHPTLPTCGTFCCSQCIHDQNQLMLLQLRESIAHRDTNTPLQCQPSLMPPPSVPIWSSITVPATSHPPTVAAATPPSSVEELGKTIARQLLQARKASSLTQQELAKKAGYSCSTVAQLEREAWVGVPSLRTVWALAAALGYAVRVELVEQEKK